MYQMYLYIFILIVDIEMILTIYDTRLLEIAQA